MLASCADFQIETTGPKLANRGGLYGVGQARCSVGRSDRMVEKRYSSWCCGTVDSGCFRYYTASDQVLAVPGMVLFGNAGEAFAYENLWPDGNDRSVIAFNSAVMAEVGEALGLDDLAFRVSGVPPSPKFAALYGAVRQLTGCERTLEDALFDLVAATLSIGRRPREWKRCGRQIARVLGVVKHLENSYAAPFCLEDLATIANLSRFHFIRVFRQVTGVSPHQFIIGRRLRAAAERLRTTADPITRVALETGFNDVSNFNRTFRRAFGMSPRRWRAGG